MATAAKGLLIKAGILSQLASDDTMLLGALDAYDGTSNRTLTLGADNATVITIGANAAQTSVNIGTGANVATVNIGTGNATGDVNIGAIGSMTTIKGDFTVDGAETITGISTFESDVTLKGDVEIQGDFTMGNATTDDITFIGSVASDIVFKAGSGRTISIATAAAGGDNLTITPGSGAAANVGGNLYLKPGVKGAGSTDGKVYVYTKTAAETAFPFYVDSATTAKPAGLQYDGGTNKWQYKLDNSDTWLNFTGDGVLPSGSENQVLQRGASVWEARNDLSLPSGNRAIKIADSTSAYTLTISGPTTTAHLGNGGALTLQAGANTSYKSGAISAFADAGGGKVTATSAGHTLVNGDTVTITDNVSYNGTYVISGVASGTFDFTCTFVADGTGNYSSYANTNGGNLTILAGAKNGTGVDGNIIIGSSNTALVKVGVGANYLQFDTSTNTLSCAGTALIDLPTLFKIAGTAVGATVTAANLDDLTDGSNADALHVHTAISGGITVPGVLAENVTTGMAAGFADNGSSAPRVYKIDGQAALGTATTPYVSGLVLASKNSGETVSLVTSGKVSAPTAVWVSAPAATDVGKPVYAATHAAGTDAGKLTLTAPTTAGHVRTRVGFLSTGGDNPEVVVQIGEPILL